MTPPADPIPEDHLLLRWRDAADRAALAELFRGLAPVALRVARRLLGDAPAAEDAVQGAFVAVMVHARRYRGGSARAWILAIVANAARRRRRDDERRRRRELAAGADRGGAAAPPPDDAEDLREPLARALARLPERLRQPVELRYLEGLAFADIASALAIPEKTARSRVGRGLDRLRAGLVRAGVALAAVAVAERLAREAAGEPAIGAVADLEALARLPAAGSAVLLPTVGAGASWALAALLGAAVVAGWFAIGGRAGDAPRADAAPAPVASPLAALLARPVTVRLLGDDLADALAEVERALPPDTPLRYAIPPLLGRRFAHHQARPWPWAGVSLEGTMPLRAALDAIAAQGDLAWTEAGDHVVFSRAVAADDASARVAAPNSALTLSETEDPPIFAPAWNDPRRIREAVLASLAAADGGGAGPAATLARALEAEVEEIDGPRVPFLAGLAHDDELVAALARALRTPGPASAFAARVAGAVRAPALVEALLGLVEQGPAGDDAIVALGLIGEPRAVAPLLRVVDGGAGMATSAAAIAALGRLRDPAAVPALARIVADEDAALRARGDRNVHPDTWRSRAAIQSLARIPGDAADQALLAALAVEDGYTARWAAFALAGRGGAAGFARIAERLRRGESDDADNFILAPLLLVAADGSGDLLATVLELVAAGRIDAGSSYLESGMRAPDKSARVVDRLFALIDDASAPSALRRDAAVGLAQERPRAIADRLIDSYRRWSADARGEDIIHGLAASRDPRSVAVAVDALAAGRFAPAAAAAIAARLAGSRAPAAQAYLARVARTGDDQARAAALRALAARPDADAVAALRTALADDRSARVRGVAATCLGAHVAADPRRDGDLLVAALAGDVHPFVRASSANALARFRDRDPRIDPEPVEAALRRALAADPAPQARLHGAVALDPWRGGAADVAALAAALRGDPDRRVRTQAATALEGVASDAAHPERALAEAALGRALAEEPDPALAAEIARLRRGGVIMGYGAISSEDVLPGAPAWEFPASDAPQRSTLTVDVAPPASF